MRIVIGFLNRFKNIRFMLILCIFVEIIISLLALANPEVLRLSINAVTSRDMYMLRFVVVFAVVTTLLFISFSAVNKILKKSIANRYEEAAQGLLIEKMLSIRKIRLQSFNSGEVNTHIVNNAMNGVNNSLQSVYFVSEGIAVVILGSVYMGLVEWRIALAIILYNIILRFVLLQMEKKIKTASREEVSVVKSNNSFLFDILTNMITVRVFKKGAWFKQKLNLREKNTLRVKLMVGAWRNGTSEVMWSANKLAEYFIMFGFGGYLVFNGQTELGTLLAFHLAVGLFNKGLLSFTRGMGLKNQAIANIEGMEEILNIEEIESEKSTPIENDNFIITFKNVGFSFGEREILKDVNFCIAPKEKILIKGPNGQGKSTLLNLLAGLYRPDSGEILFGHYDISVINLDEIAKKYTYISQNSNIVQGNVYQNIALSEDYAKELCDEILRKLNMEKHWDASPESLSQGEKQRLNIGRSILRLPQVSLILCDEIFSNIDAENAKQISAVLCKEFENHTVIMVCHDDIEFPFDRTFYVENKAVSIQ